MTKSYNWRATRHVHFPSLETMEAMRQSWTDDHLDDLSHRMDERFDRVEGEMKEGFDRVDSEMKAGFARVDSEMKAGFARVDGEIKELRGEIKGLGKELRGEMAGVEGRLRAQSSEQYLKTREEIARIHNDNQQMHAELHAFQRTIVQIAAGTAGTILVTILGLLVAKI